MKMNDTMIDKAEIECRFRRSVDSYDENAIVQKLIVNQLRALLKKYLSQPVRNTLEIGCGTGLLTSTICEMFQTNLYVNDLVSEMCHRTAYKCDIPDSHCLIGDVEALELKGKYDLIVSSSTFQWFTRPADTFSKLSAHIEPSGFLIFSTFGCENLKELRSVTGQGLAYHTPETLAGLLSPYFDILYTGEDFHTLSFADPIEILRHVKYTGVNATASPQIRTKGGMLQFTQEYKRLFLSDGCYPLTYHPLYFVCRKKCL